MKTFFICVGVVLLVLFIVSLIGSANAGVKPIGEKVGDVLDSQIYKFTDGDTTCYIARHYQGIIHAGPSLSCVKN